MFDKEKNNHEYAPRSMFHEDECSLYEYVIVLLCISLAIDPQSQVQRPDRILP